ncbi:hypothetical protein GCM10010500_69450 [Streptomyces nigrescens]|nr:hypothetical protein GCM10010500_69450 [Streptomyces libani subsp. libani]
MKETTGRASAHHGSRVRRRDALAAGGRRNAADMRSASVMRRRARPAADGGAPTAVCGVLRRYGSPAAVPIREATHSPLTPAP